MTDIETRLQALETRSLQAIAANHALKVMLQHLWLEHLRAAGTASPAQVRNLMGKFAQYGTVTPTTGWTRIPEMETELRDLAEEQFAILADEMVRMADGIAERDAEREIAEDELA